MKDGRGTWICVGMKEGGDLKGSRHGGGGGGGGDMVSVVDVR